MVTTNGIEISAIDCRNDKTEGMTWKERTNGYIAAEKIVTKM